MTSTTGRSWIGKSTNRREDPALLAGTARFTEDLAFPGMLQVAVLRSPHAHARIVGIDTSAARALPGVHAVLTGAEAQGVIGPVPRFCAEEVVQHAIAVDKVRYAGEAVAAVAADDRYIAEDALEKIVVEWELLPVLADPEAAMAPDAPLLHDNLGSNVVYEHVFTHGDVDADFASADRVIRRRLRWPRAAAVPLEGGGAVCVWDAPQQKMDVYSNTNMLNFAAWVLSATLNVAPHQLDFHPGYVGGSFGSKHMLGKHIAIAGAFAKLTGRPVRFMEDRTDNLIANDAMGPDRTYDAELAISNDGDLLSLRLHTVDDYGAYFMLAVAGNTNMMSQMVGPYRIRSTELGIKAVLTNKNQQGVIRGAGSDVGNWVLERLVDAAAGELGMDPADIRRRNFIQPDQFPYKIPNGNIYDSGDYEAVLDTTLEHADLEHWRTEQERARREGRYLGIGLVTCQHRSTYSASEFWFHNPAPYVGMSTSAESVRMSVGPTGGFTVTLFSPTWGNSPETVVSQVVAEEFGMDPGEVNIAYSSALSGLPSCGPGGSRMTVMLSGAVRGAAGKIRDKMLDIAAHLLEVDRDDLEFADGKVSVRGVPSSSLTIADIAMKAFWYKADLPEGMESGLEGSFTYDHPLMTLPNDDRSDLGAFYPIMSHAAHAVLVEVDIETGHVSFLKYVAVHDSGTVVNPRSLQSQIRGGIAQGIGLSMTEEVRYADDGRNITADLDHYLLPMAEDVPRIEIHHVETPSPYTAYGVKGAGEGGRMIAPAVLSSAVEDALAPFGVKIDQLPMTPERIVGWLTEAGAYE